MAALPGSMGIKPRGTHRDKASRANIVSYLNWSVTHFPTRGSRSERRTPSIDADTRVRVPQGR